MEEEEIERRLFQPRQRRETLTVDEGARALADAGATEAEISEWVEGKVHKKFGFKSKQEK